MFFLGNGHPTFLGTNLFGHPRCCLSTRNIWWALNIQSDLIETLTDTVNNVKKIGIIKFYIVNVVHHQYFFASYLLF